MYKAGFLDASKPKTKKDWADMNKRYKGAFMRRFGAKITGVLKKNEKEKKN